MEENCREELSSGVIATIRSAAEKLTGFQRRRFQAEVATRYCQGSARKAERVFGWSRDAVHTGLGELRSGLRCIESFGQRGRKKVEEQSPRLAEEIRKLVEPTAQADPKFQTTLAYTRITAEKVRDELLKIEAVREVVPTRQTVGEVLNRMGYRLQRVLKTKPQKKCRRPTPFSHTSPPRSSVRRLTPIA